MREKERDLSVPVSGHLAPPGERISGTHFTGSGVDRKHCLEAVTRDDVENINCCAGK
jgi:hypothetical protein